MAKARSKAPKVRAGVGTVEIEGLGTFTADVADALAVSIFRNTTHARIWAKLTPGRGKGGPKGG